MRTVLLGAVLLAMGAVPAGAADAERGKDLATRWCVNCHVIGPDIPGGDVGPAFESVAKRDGQNVENLRNWLAEPHPPMPDFDLTATEYDDLAGYIMSLVPE